jgi:Spx/MgsR family transcriptional regulator
MYGIKNCDTVKKARKFLDAKEIEYEFHDFKKTPPTKTQIDTWLKSIDWKILLNMRGMTWRKLSESEKESIDKTNAIKHMLDNASIIKRPILENGKTTLVGFTPEEYEAL